MATTIQPPPTNAQPAQRAARIPRTGGPGDIPPGRGGPLRTAKYAPPPASTGMWVILAAIGMTFAALTSALIVRRGGATDWHHITLPAVLYFNTFVLILSSVTLEISRKHIAAYMRDPVSSIDHTSWLYATLALGFLFLVGQYIAWVELRAWGLYLATNPTSSFFYVFTVGHALHLTGGLGGLVRVIHKLHNSTLRRSTLDATSRYWHFMDALWVYLLVLLWMKL